VYHPATVQSPGAPQDSEETMALWPLFSAPMPGSSWALPHRPRVSLTTNASRGPDLPVDCPAAVQLPGDVHATAKILASGPACAALAAWAGPAAEPVNRTDKNAVAVTAATAMPDLRFMATYRDARSGPETR
jgi:hypothetical protein